MVSEKGRGRTCVLHPPDIISIPSVFTEVDARLQSVLPKRVEASESGVRSENEGPAVPEPSRFS
ncbi:MAG: hypothetical protein CBD91_04695 [Phycisphaeraceae bacterium TMED231]|nr:MAG: hypothetical protein CBD91_04695 [Phycisphaeraceae bacterium TMED231]